LAADRVSVCRRIEIQSTLQRFPVAAGQKLSHVVFFKLKDSSPANVQALVDACHKYLKNHPGVLFFAAGTLAKEYARPVNDHAFDVCLNLVFESRAAHDAYQTIEDHLKFGVEHKESWDKVRVFDADVT
jgi:hypothetical protein